MKRKTYLKSLLAFMLLMIGANINHAWAEDEVITLTPSKDGLVRTKTGSDTDASKNFDGKNGNGMIIMNNLPDDNTKNKFVGLMGFDLSSVKTKVDAGYTINKVALRVTNIKNDTYTLNIFKYGDSWEEGTVTWATSDHATYIDKGALGTLQTKSYNGKTAFEVAQGSAQANPYDIANRQSTLEVTSGDLFDYIVAAVTNSTVSFCLTNNNATETQLFSKDISETNWPNATTKSYTWNGSAWAEESGVNISRYAAVMRYFGLTDADVAKQLCPQLTVTLSPPAAATNTVYNVTTSTGYASLNDAFAALTDADTELQVSDDQTLTGRLTWNKAHTLTITPTKDITIKGHKNGMWFLVNTNNATLNIGSADHSITLDGENHQIGYDITKYENASTLALTNVTFKDFDLNNVGHLVGSKENEGQIVLDKVTFTNCVNPSDAYIYKARVTNDRLVLKGYLNIDANSTGTAIYAASEAKSGQATTGRIKIDDDNFTASNTITINWPNNKADGVIAVIGTKEGNATKFALTDNDWSLSRKSSNGDLYMASSHNVIVGSHDNGTIKIGEAADNTDATALYNSTVSFTATANSGYHLSSVSVKNGEADVETSGSEGSYTFTMPSANVTVSAVFEADAPAPGPAAYAITKTDATNGSYTVKVSDADVTEAAGDANVVINTTANDNYELDAVIVTKTSGGERISSPRAADGTFSFTMPSEAVTIAVTFKAEQIGTYEASMVSSKDTYLRSDNTNNNGGAATMELYTTTGDGAKDFVGLISFDYSSLIPSGKQVKTAKLKLMTERAKGNISIYPYTSTWEEDATYTAQSDAIATAKAATAIVGSTALVGQNNKAITDNGVTYNNVLQWKNVYDITDYVKGLNGSDVNLLITGPSSSTSVKLYTKEVTDVTLKDGTIFAANDLKPMLYLTFEDDTKDYTKTFKIDGKGSWDNLPDALSAASENDKISVQSSEITLNSAITFDKVIEIVPTQALTIKRGTSLAKTAILFNVTKNVTIGSSEYALTIDGQGASLSETPTEKLIQVTGGTLTLMNTTIKSYATTANQGVVCAKNNGKITMNGVTFSDCTVPSGKGVVFVGKNEGLTLAGNNVFGSYGIYVEKDLKIIDSGTTHTTAIGIIVEDDKRSANSIVVSGTSDVTKYSLVSTSWTLAADATDNNLIIAEKTYDYSKTFKVESTGSFDTLAEALAALTTTGQTILVQSNATTTMNSRIKFGGSDGYQATVTIKANDGVTYTIERGTQTGVLFNWGGNGTVTFENVIFDEKESSQGPLFETDGGSRNYVFNNVTFKNSKSSNVGGLFNLKNGSMTFNNVTLDACTVSNAFIRTAVATGGLTFTETFTVNANCSGDFIRLASGVTLDASALPAMDSYKLEIEDKTPVITNVADATAAGKFSLSTSGYKMDFDSENQKITFSEITYDYSKTFKVTGVGSFDTLAEALASDDVTDDATIIVQATEMTLDAQTAFTKSVTIIPDGDALSIKRATTLTGENDVVLFSLATADKTVTIGGDGKTITIDGQSTASGKQLVEVTNGTLKFVNTTIKDAISSHAQGVLCAKNSGTISLNGVTFNGCQATVTNAGIVFCGRNDAIQLQGNISFSGCSDYHFFLEKRLKVTNTLTASGLAVLVKESDAGIVTTLNNNIAVVYGNESYYDANHFALKNAGYTLTRAANNKDMVLEAKNFSIAIAPGIENGTVVTDAADATAVAVGTEVTITATPSSGYALKVGSLTATYGEGNTAVTITDNKFKMPAGNVTISAQFISTTVTTTPKSIKVNGREQVNGGTVKYADGSKTVASTTANNSIWYLGDVDMTKVHSITVKGAAFVNGTISDVDTKPMLKFGFLPAGTIASVSSDALSTNSGTIRDASHLMAQITATTTPTTMADGKNATEYPGADFEITADGVTQTGTYAGTVTLDAENLKGLQKMDAVYQLFLYGTAQSRRLAVDEVIFNYLGTSIPEGAYADNTYEEPMTNVGQDTEVIGEPAAGYTKETLSASADTYVRKGNTGNNGDKRNVEVYTFTDGENDLDFVGLYAFNLPVRAKSTGAEIQKVQLRLVGKRLKGNRNMNIYGFGSDFEEKDTYADLESAIAAAREAGTIHTFEMRGQKGLDVETDAANLTSYNKTIAGWTNYFDLTNYAKSISGTKLSIMIASPDNSKEQKMFYTKEAAAISNDVMTVAAADLVPQLIVVYKEGENNLNVTHPAMLHTADDLARVKGNLGLSPIREAYEHLQGSSYAQTSYTASPVEYLKRMDEANWGPSGTYGQNTDYNNYTNAMKDANAAYQLALRYQLEGSTSCADAAVKILNDWATTNKGLYKITGAGWPNDIPDPNQYLILIQGHQFANAAELLRGYSGWNSTDFTKFKSWMKTTFSDNAMLFLQNHHNNVGNKHYWLNWDLAALTSVLSVGILCDDKNLTDYAINYYKGTATTTGANTSAQEVGFHANAIPFVYAEDGTIGLGQCQESGRDQGHSLLDVALLGAFCQMAKNMGSEGADLFATNDYRAVKMAEYVGKYNLGNDVEFTTYNPNSEYNHTVISSDGRGGIRPVWELFYRYARQNSKTAKYAQQWTEKLRTENAWGEGGAGDYGTNSNGFDQLGYGTLMYADPTSADGQDTDDLSSYSVYNKAEKTAKGDTYVRTDNADTKNGSAKQLEIYNGTKSFYGLLSFTLPNSAIGHVKKAQLRLTTKRYKTGRNINIYAYSSFEEANANYTSESSAITTATGKTQLATFKPMGDSGKDVTTDDVTTITQDGWTNKIDLTNYVQGLTTKEVNLLLTDAGSATNDNSVQFFSKEWADAVDRISVTDGSILQPQLIIYHDGISSGVYSVDGDNYATLEEALEEVADGGTILVTGNATIDSQVSFSKSVTIKSNSETTARTLKRGVSDKVLYLMSSNKTVNFENIIFDENNAMTKPLMELNNSQKFALKNVTIQNSKYTGGDGLLDVKNGTLTLNGVTFKDCAVTNAFIRTAKADGGGLDLTGKVTFTNSTGNHLKLRASASIDGAAVLTAIDAPVTIEINGSDYDKLSITNVTDMSKFKLMTDGFSMKLTDGTVTFEKEADGQDTDDLTKYDGTKSTRTPDSDTFVRSTAADTKYGTSGNMEIHTTADADFAGLLSFTLPAGAVAEGSEIQKVQLRLVTKQKKSSGGINIFKVGDFSESDATYVTMSESITTARATTAIAKFYPNGQNNMDLTSDGVKEGFGADYRKLSAWENHIDLTAHVKSLGSRTVNLLLSASSNDGGALQFFTKEWMTDLTSDGTTASANAITASASDLVPQLIVIYKADESSGNKTFVIEGDGVSFATLEEALEEAADGGTILVAADADIENRIVFTKNVTIKGYEAAAATRAMTRGGSTVTRTLTRGGDGKQGVLYKTDKNVKVNFENIILDENNATSNLLEVANSQTFTLTNVTVKNSKSTSTAGVINLKSGSLNLSDVQFDNCTVSAALIVTNLKAEKAENLKVNTLTTNNLLGCIFMIQNGATLDASQITGVETITFNIGGNDGTQIINVKDEEVRKYVLKTDGYGETEKDAGTTTTLVFNGEGDGQDTVDMETYAVPEGMVKNSVVSQADNFVRNTNPTSTSDRTKEYIEVHTNIDGTTDFVGLLSFQLPYEAKSSGSEIKKVQVRLVTKQVKGGKGIRVYGINDFEENSGTWNTINVDAVRKTTPIHKFQVKGEVGFDVTKDGSKISDAYKNLVVWTNLIDLTDYAKSMSGRNLNLMLETSATDGQTKQFFTKEAKAIAVPSDPTVSGAAFNAAVEDLIPQLIIVYKAGEAEPFAPTPTPKPTEPTVLKGQDTEKINVPEGSVKNVLTPTIDTYVRKGNSGNNGSRVNMEVYTFSDSKSDLDFVGLMAFKLPDDLIKEGAKLQKAQLKFVTKRLKGSRDIDMYPLFADFTESTTYDLMSTQLENARDRGPVCQVQVKGESGKDVESDVEKLSTSYLKIDEWTNHVDLTDLVSNAMNDDGMVRLAFASPDNSKDPKHFYTKEAKDISNTKMKVSADDLVPELILVYEPGSGASTLTAKNVETASNIDLFVRKGSTSDTSISDYVEVYTFKDDKNDQDFVGLLSFNLTEEVAAARTRAANNELEVFSVTLKLVTKRLKGERDMNVYAFNSTFASNSTYSQLEEAITDTRASEKYVTFKTAGQVGKDVLTDAGLSGDYAKSISAWTNMIDITDLAKGSDAKALNIMLSAPDNARTSKQFFSKEASSFNNSNYSTFVVPDEDLVPMLIVSYRNPLYTDIEETIAIPVNDEKIYDLRGNQVKTMSKGVYIVNGKKILKK